MGATWNITRLTFLEAVRRRIVLAAFILGLAFLVLYGIGFYFILNRTGLPQAGPGTNDLLRSQVFNFLTLAGMYAVNFLGIAMGALIAADTLAGEIASGTIQTLATKPVHRASIVMGKWLGFAILLFCYLGLLCLGLVAIVYFQAQYVIPNLWAGLGLIYLESLVIMTLSIASSSRFSTLATGGIVFGLWGMAFVGGFVEQIGALLDNTDVVNLGIISSLILPTEAVFRRAAYLMTSPVARSVGLSSGPFTVISVPSPLMIVYAAVYMLGLLFLAMRQFVRRDL